LLVVEQGKRIDLKQFKHQYTLPSSNANVLFDKGQDSVSFIYTHSQKIQLLTNIESRFDHCFSLALCNSSTTQVCKHILPKVTVIPSASAEQLMDATPFRLLSIEQNENFDSVAIIKHCTIKDALETPFIQAYTTSSQPMLYFNHVWGTFQRYAESICYLYV
jgi:hypothetical protein